MSKKRVQFDLAEEKNEEKNEQSLNDSEDAQSKNPFNKKFKHTLDSDEEDDELEDARKYEFDPEQFDGEEEGNLHREGEITITPFNIKDELKEGHFDDQGTFIFNKEKEEIRDNWIDNIDWQTIKETEESKQVDQKEGDSDDESSEDEGFKRNENKSDLIDRLKRLIALMNPDETVQRAMQRLGKSKLKNVKNTAKKYGQKGQAAKRTEKPAAAEPSEEEREEQKRKENLNSLIELSNQMLSEGDMNIYEKKREALEYQLAAEEKLAKKADLDMFAD